MTDTSATAGAAGARRDPELPVSTLVSVILNVSEVIPPEIEADALPEALEAIVPVGNAIEIRYVFDVTVQGYTNMVEYTADLTCIRSATSIER